DEQLDAVAPALLGGRELRHGGRIIWRPDEAILHQGTGKDARAADYLQFYGAGGVPRLRRAARAVALRSRRRAAARPRGAAALRALRHGGDRGAGRLARERGVRAGRATRRPARRSGARGVRPPAPRAAAPRDPPARAAARRR